MKYMIILPFLLSVKKGLCTIEELNDINFLIEASGNLVPTVPVQL